MTNKQHNQQLTLIDAHLRNLQYELHKLQTQIENIVATDKANLELDAARSLIRQFQSR